MNESGDAFSADKIKQTLQVFDIGTPNIPAVAFGKGGFRGTVDNSMNLRQLRPYGQRIERCQVAFHQVGFASERVGDAVPRQHLIQALPGACFAFISDQKKGLLASAQQLGSDMAAQQAGSAGQKIYRGAGFFH
jgi:hypothetical protein